MRVFASQSRLEAEIVKGRIEAEGIAVELEGDQEGPYPVGPAELFVPCFRPWAFTTSARRSSDRTTRTMLFVQRSTASSV